MSAAFDIVRLQSPFTKRENRFLQHYRDCETSSTRIISLLHFFFYKNPPSLSCRRDHFYSGGSQHRAQILTEGPRINLKVKGRFKE